MTEFTGALRQMQPIRYNFKRIILDCIDKASDPSDQRELIMIAYENKILSCSETFALIHFYGLEAA